MIVATTENGTPLQASECSRCVAGRGIDKKRLPEFLPIPCFFPAADRSCWITVIYHCQTIPGRSIRFGREHEMAWLTPRKKARPKAEDRDCAIIQWKNATCTGFGLAKAQSTTVACCHRVRLDTPLEDRQKYLSEQDCRALHFPPIPDSELTDISFVAVIVESEKAALALTALAERHGRKLLGFGNRRRIRLEAKDRGRIDTGWRTRGCYGTKPQLRLGRVARPESDCHV